MNFIAAYTSDAKDSSYRYTALPVAVEQCHDNEKRKGHKTAASNVQLAKMEMGIVESLLQGSLERGTFKV